MPWVTWRPLLSTCVRAWPSAPFSTSRLRAANTRIPVRLFDERQLIHHDLRELRVGQVDRAPGDQDVAAIEVDVAVAEERLDVGPGQRRRELGVQPRELVAGVGPRRAEVDGEAAPGPRRPADHAGAAVEIRALEPALGCAADRRRVGDDVALIGEVRRDPRIERSLGGADVLARDVGVEPRDRDVVVLLERHPDGVGERDRQRRAGHADPRRERRRGLLRRLRRH